ncbi:glycosyltransferase, partial [Patescibacteria group bacterium]|nr:glycosyltransferase [Patescibacteria group bacterium]MBU1457574.1 glycosyltransferase [Patescibacteria group bacterium]
KTKKGDYFLIVSRLVGSKGLEEAVRAAKIGGFRLRISGSNAGLSEMAKKLEKMGGKKIELMGRVDDKKLPGLFAGAIGFIALARDEDFGITPVESMACGTPVIAFNGGGFKESVVDGVTGVLINDTDEKTIGKAVKKILNTKWDKKALWKQARKFSRERFEEEIRKVIGE